MNVAAVVLWTIAIVLTYVAVALAIVAMRPGRQWLVVPCAIPVLGVLAAGIFDHGTPLHPAVSAVLGFGIALLGVLAGSPVVAFVLQVSTRSTTLGAHGGILVRDANAPAPAQREILRGGATIGYLERFALIGAVLAGQSVAVAVIVAVKGLGRFSELENEQARERFIIGTLASLIWAGLCAAAIMTLVVD